MTIPFASLIKRKKAITYIDDTLMQAETKSELFDIIREYHTLRRSSGLKAAPDKTKLFLRNVQFLGHVVSGDGIQPVAKRVEKLKTLKSPENKRDVMRVLGCLGFYSSYIKNLHVDCKSFFDLIRDDTPFECAPNTRHCSRQSKREFRRTGSSQYRTKYTRFISMLTPKALVLAQSWSNSSLKGTELFP